MNWFACELHCHTIHSDGNFTPQELVRSAKNHGLSAISITDHNTVSSTKEVMLKGESQGLAILRGVEWTTYFGHMLVQNPNGCLDWYNAKKDNLEQKLCEIANKGGFAGVAHPCRPGNPLGTGCHWEFELKNWSNMGYFEILHGENPTFAYYNEQAIKKWTNLLDKGYKLTATSGIDWHRPLKDNSTYACTYIGTNDEKLSEQAIFDGLKSHKTSISVGMKLDFSLINNDNVYNIGDTIKPCEAQVVTSIDYDIRREIWEKYDINPKKITIISNENTVVFEGDISQKIPNINAKSGRWYVAKLYGTIGRKESLIAITSPIFCN